MRRTAPFVSLIILAAAAWLLATATGSANDYPFPVLDPLKASLIPAGYHPVRVNYQTTFLEFRADRKNAPLLKGRNKLGLGLFPQRVPAPLVFVIPGLGGHGLSEAALMLAEQLHEMGLHAVTLPDPMSGQYALGVSESTLPGYLPVDSGEYYAFLERVARHLETESHVAATGYSVVGYSFGGLLAAFLARRDLERRVFNFERVVAINPAIDVRHAIAVVDGFFAAGHGIPDSRKTEITSSMVDTVIKLANRPLTSELVAWAETQWAFTEREMKWVIGRSFRGAATGTIFASLQARELHLLTPQASPWRKPSRINEARRYSFGDYLSQLVLPHLRSSGGFHMSDEQLLGETSLGALAGDLRANSRVYVVENADDFLARPQDVEALRAWLGDRLYLYPRGGHMGNLWFERNKTDLRRIMRGTR
jgi:pimeloyl-ACP methyl ester carboxylesterase